MEARQHQISLVKTPLTEEQCNQIIGIFTVVNLSALNLVLKKKVVATIYQELGKFIGRQNQSADDQCIVADILAIMREMHDNLTLQNGISSFDFPVQALAYQQTQDPIKQIELLDYCIKEILKKRIALVRGVSPVGTLIELVIRYTVANCSRLFSGILILIDLRDAYQKFTGEDCYKKYLLPWDVNASLATKESICYQSFNLTAEQQSTAQLLPIGNLINFFIGQAANAMSLRKKLTSSTDPNIPLKTIVDGLIPGIIKLIHKISQKPIEQIESQPHFLAYVTSCISLLAEKIKQAGQKPECDAKTGRFTLAGLIGQYKLICKELLTNDLTDGMAKLNL